MKEGERMKVRNQIEFKVTAKNALFSDPITRASGEKFSYQIPTYEALKGVVKSIYFKPTITWIVDEVRVMKPIQFTSKGIRPINYSGGNTLSYYTYLCDVEYQVRAHFEWNLNHPELEYDRNEHKHYLIAKRMISRGGRRDVYLGTRECQAYVEPCEFGEGLGYYDDQETYPFSTMVHGLVYPDEYSVDEEKDKLVATFWTPVMKKGVIKFIRPDECTLRRVVGKGRIKMFGKDSITSCIELAKEGDISELGE